ncbi:MAG: TIR domain-containing protein [Leptolyngbyaceae cyanobacterium MO_188.B28]|nr:TIR domain-containing protein [Leptolyngbyaceae cyanobacterium MO_188.B28]
MGQLASLRQLHLRSNQLSQQPPEMGQLTNLSLIALEAARANEYENWQVSDLIEFAKIDGADFSAFPEPISESVTSQGKKEPIEIFLSYAHKDETLRDSLATHLEKLESPRLITTWHDRNITVGDDWKEEILGQLNWVDIILLLFSDDFFASDCCWGEDDIGQLVNLRPKSASSHNNLGNVYGEQGEYAKAISAYQNALKWNLVYTLVNEGGVGRNLSNANLSNVGLSGADFRGTDLNETNFSKADLNETNLSKVNINSNSPPEEPRPMTGFQDVFISYGRDDSKAFAAKLHQRLMAEGLEVWFDFEDIPLGVDFQSEINGGIEKAHNFLFVISPSSVNSKYCLKEIEHALKHNKRIIPLLYVEEIDQETWRQRNPDGTDEEWEAFKAARKNVALENMHPEVRKINWVYFREGIDDFEKSLAGLLDIFYRHQDYVRQHTYWLNQALTWEQHRKKSRYLLIGEERQQAEDWLKIHFEYEQPPCLPTDLHCEFITESIKHANNRMSQVFLAHAEEDAVLAEKVRHSLIRGGITVWTSGRDIETGEDFQAAINRAIKEADNLVYLLSSASLQSDYCQHEINYALSLNKRIIPLLARPLDPSQIPEALRNLQYINLTDNRVNLSNADINGANLRGANLRGSIISDKTELDSKWHLVYTLVNEGGVGRNLSGANLSRANLSNVDINGINLRKATLCRTDLSDANDRKLLPIRVVPCQLTRMLAPLVYVDLVGKPEAEAAPLFLAPLKERAKPTTRPAFPQSVSVPEWVTSATVVFPGATQTLPFLRTPFFTGREALLEAIHTMLNSRGRVALSGLGGIGKTQIALEYAYRHQAGYERVFWVRAEQPEELVSEYVALAKVLQIPGAQQEDQLAVVTLAKQWLATHDGWLLVLDNADDLRQVRPYLPASSGHILLTTRAQSLGDLAQALPVNQMGKEEGALFLLRRSKVIGEQADFSEALETEQGLARQLTIEMDGLPLALDQAGAYIEDQCLSLEEYLELFQTKKAELLRERGRLDPDHPSVTVTFTLVFEKVAAANELAANLVRACAFLSPDAIPEEIFSDGVKELGDPLSPLAVSKLALTKAIAEAARFSLISRNPRTKTLTIHRLVQEVLRGEMDGETQKNWSETVMQAVTAVFPNAEYENWPQCDRLLPQSQKAAQLISDYGVESKTAALLLSRVGYYFDKLGRYGEAEPLLVEALGMTKRLLGDEHPDVARSLNNLAALYDSQGRYGEAEPLYVEALGMRKRLLGDEHPAVANTLWNLGAMRYQQQQFVEAEALLLEALPIYQKALGENHPNTQSLRSWLKKVQDTLGADA